MSTIKVMNDTRKIAVIGGGAAGMMAAVSAAKAGAQVTIYEKNDRPGRKLRITGKGRCNVTNDCDLNEFLRNVPTNSRFLYAALTHFSTADTKTFFENAGVPLKTERGNRVFPVSDKAQDIVDALVSDCRREKVRFVFEKVKKVHIRGGSAEGVETESGVYAADAVIVSTGGMSYPLTGSDGDGYRFAKESGISVTPLLPSLVPIVSKDPVCGALQGLSLRNVSLRICEKGSGKTVFEDFGEMMFTHFGLTGPMILSASAHIPDITPGKYEAVIDLKPALDRKTLDLRLQHDFIKYNNRDFGNSLGDLLPQKMIGVVIGLTGIPPHKKVNSVTREERTILCDLLKHFRIPLFGFRPIAEAIVTKGGVDVKELNPKTMEAKAVKGLYFVGEVLDVDAYTGGFNLQIAFSTATLAGENAAIGQ